MARLISKLTNAENLAVEIQTCKAVCLDTGRPLWIGLTLQEYISCYYNRCEF